jgi:hypothetical protein
MVCPNCCSRKFSSKTLKSYTFVEEDMGCLTCCFPTTHYYFFRQRSTKLRWCTQVLRRYEKGTEQLIHPSKCSMLTSVLDVGNIASEEKYRMSKKFTNWAERYMSVRAKEVLIKSVAQAVPTYVMGVFKLPTTLCDELTRMVRHIWWGDEDGHRKIHWLAWDHLLLPKCMGGMGFRDTRLFNQHCL